MMRTDASDEASLTLVCLHFLGGSAASWSAVAERLAGRVRCLKLDLPGFGDASGQDGYGVAEMADSIAARLDRKVTGNWMIAGHSMGAKVAALLARRAENGVAKLAGLRGMVLLGGSPPSPEPMPETQRESMLGWFTGDQEAWPEQAREYIANNIAAPLQPATMERAVADLLRMRPSAWVAWLRAGSREDWADRIGILRTPTLILSGSEDSNLGEDAQKRLTAPHYASHRSMTLAGTGHLLPMEQPGEVARLITAHVDEVRNPT